MAPLWASCMAAGMMPALLMEPRARSASREAPFELDIMLVRFPAACRSDHEMPVIGSCLCAPRTKWQDRQCCSCSPGLMSCFLPIISKAYDLTETPLDYQLFLLILQESVRLVIHL